MPSGMRTTPRSPSWIWSRLVGVDLPGTAGRPVQPLAGGARYAIDDVWLGQEPRSHRAIDARQLEQADLDAPSAVVR